ncbi:MAG: hypothetical protein U9N84_07625 [Actinomycetota bacterium]|nr:hypothetical protein [Actinomycetota bacterium]
MSSTTYLSVLRAIDNLYESVVTVPANWTEQSFADWANEALAEASELPREAIREVRRCLRAAQKLQLFWATAERTVTDHDDWRSKVDIALGPRAWRPTLDLARVGLSDAPCEELFLEVKERFPVVNSERWMDGLEFEDWAANR